MKAITSFFAVLFIVAISFYFTGINNVSADIATPGCAEFIDVFAAGGTVDLAESVSQTMEWEISACGLPADGYLSFDLVDDFSGTPHSIEISPENGSKFVNFEDVSTALDDTPSYPMDVYVRVEDDSNVPLSGTSGYQVKITIENNQ